MKMHRSLALLLAAAACSESTESTPDAGMVDAGGVADLCADDAPCALTLGMPSTESIAPVGDADPYIFDVATPGQIINITVNNDTELSTVALEVILFGPDGISIENRRGTEGRRQTIVIQREAIVAGTYRIVVRDVANDDDDDRNPYQIRVELLSQTDTNEPNNSPSAPTLLTPDMTASGVIGTQGDEDWFRVSIGENQLIEITATTAMGDAAVRFGWTLYEPTGVTPLASSTEPSAGAWPVEVRAVGNAAGDYLIAVRADGDQFDLNRLYTLSVRLLNEPDAQDLAAPNETVAT
ncbi:MAG: hypothetical protein AAFN74_19265, partial [Myxococcota bacterium]